MFKLKTIALSVCGVFALGGCASLYENSASHAWEVHPDYGVKHGGGTPEGLYQLGRHFHLKVDYEPAIAAYRQALERDPGFVKARNGLGVIYAAQGRYEDAIREFQSAIGYGPGTAYLHNNLGYAYLLQGSNERAVKALEEARRLDPGSENVRHNLGLAYQRSITARTAQLAAKPMASPAATPKTEAQPGGALAPVVSAPAAGISLVAVEPNIYELQAPAAAVAQETQQAKGSQDQQAAQLKPYTLEVSNGNGVTGMAKRVAGHLKRIGVSTSRLTNQLPFRQPATEVQYRDGYRAEAGKLASTLDKPVAVVRNDGLRSDIHVRLVLGRDVHNETALFEPESSKAQLAVMLERKGGK